MTRVTDEKPYLLVDYHVEQATAVQDKEIRMWLGGSKNLLFPEVIEHWKDEKDFHFILKPIQGELLKTILRKQDKRQKTVFALLPELKNLFQELYNLQIILHPANRLISRIVQTNDEKLQFIPSLLCPLFGIGASEAEPFVKSSGLVLLPQYIKAFGNAVFMLLTDSPPPEKNFENLTRFGLTPEIAKPLQRLLSGEAYSFNVFDSVIAEEKPLEVLSVNVGIKHSPVDFIRDASRQAGHLLKAVHEAVPLTGTESKAKRGSRKIKLETLMIFSRQMGMLIKNGVTLARSLEIISQQADNKVLQQMVNEVRQSVETGLPFSEALSGSSVAFPSEYIAMVRSGENAGFLVEALERLSTFLEKEYNLIKKIKGAMTYPITMFSASLLVIFAIVKFVFPTFLGMFRDMQAQLPLITQIVMGLVKFLQNPLGMMLIVLLVFFIIYGFRAYARIEEGRENLDRLLLRLPIFGKVYLKVASTRFCRTLASLYGNGIPFTESLGLVGHVIGNKVFEKELDQARMALTVGGKVSEALEEGKLFPTPVVYMVALGEETGELVRSLNKIADYYDAEVEYTLDSLSSLLEPVIIAFMGIIMGTFMMAIFLPLYQMINKLGG